MDILDYAKSISNQTFDVEPLNVLDIALLTELNYLVFQGVLKDDFCIESGLSLAKLAEGYQKDWISTPNELIFAYDSRLKMLEILSKSSRFKEIIAFAHQDVFDNEQETQFSATSFQVDKQTISIFRGTDNSMVGWKEDFNLSFLEEIPSQKLACPISIPFVSHKKIPLSFRDIPREEIWHTMRAASVLILIVFQLFTLLMR